ncbi:hypothetical protein [Streptomyces sp. NPDC051569]|uniref:hypothetical protein n=1 Tax=Streptomyces sp. NPDC051569 TaxID=3365661 RepID=UPI0037A31EFA
MSGQTEADPAELRASAHAEEGIAQAMKGPSDKAVTESGAAAGALEGWSVGPSLRTLADSWKPALNGLRERMRTGADNLRTSADGHEWNEQATAKDFEGLEGTGTLSAPAAGITHPVARAPEGPWNPADTSTGHAFGPPPGDFDITAQDPRGGYMMPTYDGDGATGS